MYQQVGRRLLAPSIILFAFAFAFISGEPFKLSKFCEQVNSLQFQGVSILNDTAWIIVNEQVYKLPLVYLDQGECLWKPPENAETGNSNEAVSKDPPMEHLGHWSSVWSLGENLGQLKQLNVFVNNITDDLHPRHVGHFLFNTSEGLSQQLLNLDTGQKMRISGTPTVYSFLTEHTTGWYHLLMAPLTGAVTDVQVGHPESSAHFASNILSDVASAVSSEASTFFDLVSTEDTTTQSLPKGQVYLAQLKKDTTSKHLPLISSLPVFGYFLSGKVHLWWPAKKFVYLIDGYPEAGGPKLSYTSVKLKRYLGCPSDPDDEDERGVLSFFNRNGPILCLAACGTFLFMFVILYVRGYLTSVGSTIGSSESSSAIGPYRSFHFNSHHKSSILMEHGTLSSGITGGKSGLSENFSAIPKSIFNLLGRSSKPVSGFKKDRIFRENSISKRALLLKQGPLSKPLRKRRQDSTSEPSLKSPISKPQLEPKRKVKKVKKTANKGKPKTPAKCRSKPKISKRPAAQKKRSAKPRSKVKDNSFSNVFG